MRKIIMLALVAVVLVGTIPAVADSLEVHLRNGNMLGTRYVPTQSPWDSSKVMLLTLMGNRVSIPADDIVRIVSGRRSSAHGVRLDSLTVLIGVAPNDKLTPEEAAALEGQFPQQQLSPSYNIEQFAEPDGTGGIPLNFLGMTTPPLGRANTFGGAASLRRGGGGNFGEPQTRN